MLILLKSYGGMTVWIAIYIPRDTDQGAVIGAEEYRSKRSRSIRELRPSDDCDQQVTRMVVATVVASTPEVFASAVVVVAVEVVVVAVKVQWPLPPSHAAHSTAVA